MMSILPVLGDVNLAVEINADEVDLTLVEELVGFVVVVGVVIWFVVRNVAVATTTDVEIIEVVPESCVDALVVIVCTRVVGVVVDCCVIWTVLVNGCDDIVVDV